MQVIDWPHFLKNGLPLDENFSSMTVGVFDGIHRGHQALIERIVSYNLKSLSLKTADTAPADGIKTPSISYVPVVITFRENHKTRRGLQTFQEKIETLERLGVKITVVIDFTDSFRRMSGTAFLEILLKRGSIGFFAAGSGFRCGYQLDTDAQAIQKFFAAQNIPVEIVSEVMEDGLPISSSRIRSAITNGNPALAEKMLGRSISMTPNLSQIHSKRF